MFKASKIGAVAVAAALAASVGLFGCSNSDSQASASVEEAPSYVEFGTNDDAATSIQVTNATGKTITNIAIKATADEAYPEGIMAEGQEWAADETVIVYFENGKETYNMLVTAGEETFELHEVALANLAEATLSLTEEGVPYLTYTADGEEASTLEAELAWRQAEADRLAAEAQAQAEAEAAAAAAAATPTYDYSYSSSPSTGGSGVSQGNDGCVSGGVVLR